MEDAESEVGFGGIVEDIVIDGILSDDLVVVGDCGFEFFGADGGEVGAGMELFAEHGPTHHQFAGIEEALAIGLFRIFCSRAFTSEEALFFFEALAGALESIVLSRVVDEEDDNECSEQGDEG